MRQKIWAGCKFVVPFTIILYAFGMLLDLMEEFWSKLLFSHIKILEANAPLWMISFLSIILTLALLLFVGCIVETDKFKRIFKYVAGKIPILNLIWSAKEEEAVTPVLFQHPIEGEWKIGYLLGKQKLSDGRVFHRVYFFTGIGDHELIDANRPDLLIKLANPPQEIIKLIASLMVHGPEELKILKENRPDNPQKPATKP
ncbi:hypothetical protein A2926_04625 [Candidatus Giovannonibacteria bacterium RIFCSPLOWO2_01_FULL_44_40]|uniref:Uncharacterized protein n=1 Tax=Candidatus Giovannonibacteria bacterium RIFCSPHIGHO2_01_FULL_45_23 TaxID=1798325 RepID=A0A1F5VJ86_9BACT|nr:MAG: hypothetical protein A2834_03070 [Candidatus Giovannonibacteria bacterium RIFCSPHIGHO2_01_FULL_45_23]OGF75614.1 MAG: hypothetical protein A3C77_00930 [Candidatus Giovannonibacteria bacterium RIFCSPHIGHO2_02_FULL_45_13]OGF80121.1 MAG: hypothetical protein A2926_04625 [Candidatus Giovannonibacteria bacterium RIFCSPLOWO2_01_FULL_44_40]